MFGDEGDRASTTGAASLRGWLSDVYFPALFDGAPGGQRGTLAARLGPRAAVVDPRLGRASGAAAIEEQLGKTAAFFAGFSAKYERAQFTTGIDRDVTEGTLTLTKDGRTFELPVAVVAERRAAREVELRVYYAVRAIAPGEPLPSRPPMLPLPEGGMPTGLVADLLSALRRGDVGGTLATLEEGAVARDAEGHAFGRANDTLAPMLTSLLPLDLVVHGYADDGRTCAIEHAAVKRGGKDLVPEPGLTVLERGDSGLFRAIRFYEVG